MKLQSFVFCFLISAAGLGFSGELEDILEKHYEALGGKDVLAKTKSLKIDGKIIINQPGGQLEFPFEVKLKDRDKIRVDSTFNGMTMTQCFDGEKGWQIMPMMGVTEPQDMSEEEQKPLEEQADFLGHLYDWKAKGNKLELMGKEDVEGTEAYKIKIVTEDGEERFEFLDSEYYVTLKTVATMKQMGQEIEAHTYLSDYKPVEGLMIPYAIEIKNPEGVTMWNMSYNTVEMNPTIDDSLFDKPEVEATEEQ